MKKILIILFVSLVLILLFLCFEVYKFNLTNNDTYIKKDQWINSHDGTYIIDEKSVTLKNGLSEVEIAPGSASKIITRYFGNEVKHDFNNDGVEDSVFIISQETGGSGIFYYVVALLNTANGPVGSSGLLLGDRIAPQTTEMGKGNIIIVNYAERKPGESFTTPPSVGKSIWILLDTKTMQFGEVAQNFEGEADPSRMTLGMKTWSWINTLYSDDKIISPNSPNKFTITFNKDGTFSATTDCNSVGGDYILNNNEISFSKMMSTLMYCEGSQEGDFTKMLEQTQSYMFSSKGELVLLLKYDSGSVFFK